MKSTSSAGQRSVTQERLPASCLRVILGGTAMSLPSKPLRNEIFEAAVELGFNPSDFHWPKVKGLGGQTHALVHKPSSCFITFDSRQDGYYMDLEDPCVSRYRPGFTEEREERKPSGP
jgi:hypothetical protein